MLEYFCNYRKQSNEVAINDEMMSKYFAKIKCFHIQKKVMN